MSSLLGKTFFNPLVDYLLIGGLLSFPLMILGDAFPHLLPQRVEVALGIFIIINGAHFASSTLRLYTKPGAAKASPVASIYAPIVCVGILFLALDNQFVSSQVTNLYMTWSPYHYAAQTYGIATIYSYRSGCRLADRDRRYLWWISMLPFFSAFLASKEGGIGWFVPASFLAEGSTWAQVLAVVSTGVRVAMYTLPFKLFFGSRRRGTQLPLMSLVLLGTNALWWQYLDFQQAWWWAALFHSIQYLILIILYHIADRTIASSSTSSRSMTGTVFYLTSVAGAIALFFLIPEGLTAAGYDRTLSYLMVLYLVNMHHFFVDGFIWRNRPAKGTMEAIA